MRSAHSAFLLLVLLLCNCQGPRLPKVKVVINHLQPGMLQGKTVGVEGMEITANQWPGKEIDAPILDEAERALRPVLKGARVCLTPVAARIRESRRDETGGSTPAAATSSKTRPQEPDYIFRIMLRADSISRSDEVRRDFDYMHVAQRSSGMTSSSYPSPGYQYRGFGFGGFGLGGYNYGYSGPFSVIGGYIWKQTTKRTLKADYILSDARTCKLIWRAEAVAYDSNVITNNSVVGFRPPPYRSAEELESKVPLKPLWILMNAAAVRRIR